MSVQLEFQTVEASHKGDSTRRQLRHMTSERERRIASSGYCWRQGTTRQECDVIFADWLTSLADARAAKSIALGIPMDDIDPATGKEYSKRVYITHRKGWQRWYDGRLTGSLGGNPGDLIPEAEEARQEFLAKRPDLDDGQPWITPHRTAK